MSDESIKGNEDLDMVRKLALPIRSLSNINLEMITSSIETILTLLDKSQDPKVIDETKEVLSIAVRKGLLGPLTQLGKDLLPALGLWGKNQGDPNKKLIVLEAVNVAFEQSNVQKWEILGEGEKKEEISMHDLAVKAMVDIGGSFVPDPEQESRVVGYAINKLVDFSSKGETPLARTTIRRALGAASYLKGLQGVYDVNILNTPPQKSSEPKPGQ